MKCKKFTIFWVETNLLRSQSCCFLFSFFLLFTLRTWIHVSSYVRRISNVRCLLHTFEWIRRRHFVSRVPPVSKSDLAVASVARSVMNIKWIYVNQSKSHFSCYLCAVTFVLFALFSISTTYIFSPSIHRPKCRIFTRVSTKPRNFPADSSSKRSPKRWHTRWPRLLLLLPPLSLWSFTDELIKWNVSCFFSIVTLCCFAVRRCWCVRVCAEYRIADARHIFLHIPNAPFCFVLFSVPEIPPPFWPEHLFNLPINYTWHNQWKRQAKMNINLPR